MKDMVAVAAPEAHATAERLRPVLLRLARELRREAVEAGLTAGQVTLLASIRDEPGIGVSELAQREQVSAPSMSAAIDRLQAMALVTRTRAEHGAPDRRRVGLAITTEGRRRLQVARRRRTAWLTQRLERLDAGDAEAVAAALPALERLLAER